MAEPTLVQVFGAGATQSGTVLTIAKADLEAVGLTISSNNTAESLLAAVLKLASNYLTEANFTENIDQSVTINQNDDTLITRNTVRYRQSSMTVEFSKIDDVVGFDPDNY